MGTGFEKAALGKGFDRAVEALALAYETHGQRGHLRTEPLTADHYRALVRAVLGAIREPDGQMHEALSYLGKLWRELDSATVWRTYVDALLAQAPPKE